MKIISATCNKSANRGEYMAVVQIENEGETLQGIAYDNIPVQALHAALSEVTGKVTAALHNSLGIEIQVSF